MSRGSLARYIAIGAVIGGVATMIYKAWRDNFLGIQNIVSFVGENLKTVFSFIAKAGQLAPQLIATTWNGFVSTLGGSIKTIIGWIENLINLANKIPGISIDVSALQKAKNGIDAFSSSVKVTQQDVSGAFAKIGNSISGVFSSVFSVASSVGSIFSGTSQSITNASSQIQDANESISSSSSKTSQDIEKDMIEQAKNRKKMVTDLSDFKRGIDETLSDLRLSHRDTTESIKRDIKELELE